MICTYVLVFISFNEVFTFYSRFKLLNFKSDNMNKACNFESVSESISPVYHNVCFTNRKTSLLSFYSRGACQNVTIHFPLGLRIPLDDFGKY